MLGRPPIDLERLAAIAEKDLGEDFTIHTPSYIDRGAAIKEMAVEQGYIEAAEAEQIQLPVQPAIELPLSWSKTPDFNSDTGASIAGQLGLDKPTLRQTAHDKASLVWFEARAGVRDWIVVTKGDTNNRAAIVAELTDDTLWIDKRYYGACMGTEVERTARARAFRALLTHTMQQWPSADEIRASSWWELFDDFCPCFRCEHERMHLSKGLGTDLAKQEAKG